MMTKRLMASGGWDLTLIPGTPRSVRRTLEISTADDHGFNQLVVTPARFDPLDLDGDDIFDAAEYVGVHRMTDGLVLSGPGVEFWAGDEFGKFDGSAATLAADTKTFADWVAAICSNGSQITTGSVEAIATSFAWDPPPIMSPRDMLDYVCVQKGAEWRINNDLTVDAGTIAHLYSTTPRAVVGVQARGGPEPGGYRAVGGKVRLTTSLEDWVGQIEYSGAGTSGGYTRASLPYTDPLGATFLQTLFVEDDSDSNADATTRATARIVYGADTIKRTYTVEGLGTRKPLTDIGTPGEYLYVFDPGELLLDTANQIHLQGGPIWPMKLRIIAVGTPLRRGQGVLYRYWDGVSAFVNLDITDYIDWAAEATREATIEVGHPSDSWVATQRRKYEEWSGNR